MTCTAWHPGMSHIPKGRTIAASMAPNLQIIKAGEHFMQAGELFNLAANRLPNFYSSKQGLTNENPATFGGGGLALVNCGESLCKSEEDDDDALATCASDLFFAAVQLEPVELGASFDAAGDALESGDTASAADALGCAADEIEQYGLLLAAEDASESSAGAMLRDAAAHVRAAASALLPLSAGRSTPVTMNFFGALFGGGASPPPPALSREASEAQAAALGVQLPAFEVLRSGDGWEVRKYQRMQVVECEYEKRPCA